MIQVTVPRWDLTSFRNGAHEQALSHLAYISLNYMYLYFIQNVSNHPSCLRDRLLLISKVMKING